MQFTRIAGPIANVVMILTGSIVVAMSPIVMNPLLASSHSATKLNLTQAQTEHLSFQTTLRLLWGGHFDTLQWPHGGQFYSPAATTHLQSVAGIVRVVAALFLIAAVALATSTWRHRHDAGYRRSIVISCWSLLGAFIVIGAVVVIGSQLADFLSVWNTFHRDFLPDGFFSRSDTMVRLYSPSQFWNKFCVTLGSLIVTLTTVVLVANKLQHRQLTISRP